MCRVVEESGSRINFTDISVTYIVSEVGNPNVSSQTGIISMIASNFAAKPSVNISQ